MADTGLTARSVLNQTSKIFKLRPVHIIKLVWGLSYGPGTALGAGNPEIAPRSGRLEFSKETFICFTQHKIVARIVILRRENKPQETNLYKINCSSKFSLLRICLKDKAH